MKEHIENSFSSLKHFFTKAKRNVNKLLQLSGLLGATHLNANPQFSSVNSYNLSNTQTVAEGHEGSSSRNIRRIIKRNGKTITYIGVIVFIVLIVAFALWRVTLLAKSGGSSSALRGQVNVPGAKKSLTLNKEFSFPLKDKAGKEVSKIKVMILNAEERDAIYIKGRRATTLNNRTFLILNMKITNDYAGTIQLKTRDYFRLSLNNSSEKLAPDIHNDPVEVQASSTKYTRMGFPINNSDKNLLLQVGEVNGAKQTIPLQFK